MKAIVKNSIDLLGLFTLLRQRQHHRHENVHIVPAKVTGKCLFVTSGIEIYPLFLRKSILCYMNYSNTKWNVKVILT